MSFYKTYTSTSFTQNDEIEEENYNRPKLAGNGGIITINNNTDLKQVSSSGNGSQSNPFMIKDKTINGNGSLYCILINNTNKFFILKDCILYNSTYGLYLNNITNGYVILNFLYNSLSSGICIENSFNNTLLSNTIYDCKSYGIITRNCNHTDLRSNFIWNNNNSGIFLYNSLFNNITANIIDYHYYPIFLQNSNYTYVINNTGYGNDHDIKELNCDNSNFFEGNIFRSSIGTREQKSSNNSSDNDATILDFTVILVVGMGIFCFAILLERIKLKK